MAESGGSSTISGVEYEHWVFVQFIVYVLLNESDNITVTPQKVRENSVLPDSQIKKNAIDDLVVTEDTKTTHYTIKQHATTGVWNVAQLKSAGIINDMKKQHEVTPDRELILISQSDSPIIREFIRLEGCISRKEIEDVLSVNLISQWDALKSAFDYDDIKMLEISKKIGIRVMDADFMRKNIETSFKVKFNTPEYYSDALFTFAFSRSIPKLATNRKEILNYLYTRGIIEKTTLSDEAILSSLRNSTTNLEASVSPFEFEHIDRASTIEVMDWILKDREWNDQNTSKILTLAGKAGMGKTTVLQDVLKELHVKDIPVLAIKADKVSFETSDELGQLLHLPDKVERIIARLSEICPKTVLLIDQIDALSLSLSSDRTQLGKYKELISRCLKLPNVLIVLSCRTYDLNNDLDLNQYKANHKIEVGQLSKEEIIIALEHAQIDSNVLPKETLELLSTPLHLSIFLQLSKSVDETLPNFTTLNELYDELLRRIVLTNANRKSILDLINIASDWMYKNQCLKVRRSLLDSEFFEELNYLSSSGIIQQSGTEVSFFHQTFFDYSLARSFVVAGKSISEELTDNLQGLYQRPRVKAVLDYLYQTNRNEFFKECDTILFDSKFRIHIKYLVINLIGFLEIEDPNCKALGRRILAEDSLKVAFLKSLMTRSWITFLVEDTNLDPTTLPLQNAVYHICHTNGSMFSDQVIDLLSKYWIQLENEKAVNCLRSAVNVSNTKFIRLYCDNKKQILEWDYLFFSILKSAVEQGEYGFVVEQFNSYYRDINRYNIELNKDYLNTMYHQVLETLWKEVPEQAYKATKKLFVDICEYSQYKTRIGKYFVCEAYADFYGVEKDGGREHYQLYTWLLKYLSQHSNSDELRIEIDTLLNLDFEISHCLVLEVMINNPDSLYNKAHSLLLDADLLLDYEESGRLLQYLTGELITVIYPLLNQEKQDEIYQACMSSKDCFVSEWSGVKRRNHFLFANRYELVTRIPVFLLFNKPERKKQMQEFQRRFGVSEWKRPKGMEAILSSGSVPLPDKAYESMTLDDLQDSFLKIEHYRRGKKHHVTIYGHAEAFQKLCKEFPFKYFDFVQRLINETPENKVLTIYSVHGILGLLESQLSHELKIEIVHSVLEKDKHFAKESYYLVRMVSHFVQSDHLTERMFNYLSRMAISNSQKVDESFHIILQELFALVHNDEYKENIFDVVEILSRGKNNKMRLELLRYLAQLNFIDKDRAAGIFCELITDLSCLSKYDYARGSIQYMVNANQNLIIPVLRNAIQEIVDEKVMEWYGQLVGILWIDEFEFSSELYNDAENRSGAFKEGILSISIDVVKEKPKDSILYSRAMANIEKYLSEDNENMYNYYQSLIRSISKENFTDFIEFLVKYINSKVRETKHRNRTLNEKLFELASDYPKECITLCEIDLGTKTFEEQFLNSYSHKSVFDVLVKAFNSLSSLYDYETRERTLDLMDKTLEVAMINQTFDLAKTFQTISQHEYN
jgi:hypothetical protein